MRALVLLLACQTNAINLVVPSRPPFQPPTQRVENVAAESAPDPLALSFAAVSQMPSRPHLKTRSRLQARLVQAALDCGQLADAVTWANRIENWRRGLALAHVAVHHARLGHEEAARSALKVAESAEAIILAEADQGWRRDRVRVRIAEAYALLGDRAKAARIQGITTPTEGARLAPLAARSASATDREEQIALLESIAKGGDLEQIRFAILAMVEVYGHALRGEAAGEQALRRGEIEGRIRGSWGELPIEPRIHILERLAEVEMEAGEGARAISFAKEASMLVTGNRWSPEQSVGLRARAAGLLFRTGQREPARHLAKEALALYDASRGRIFDVFRADALRPLAETFVIFGEHTAATEIFQRALDEAARNPNARPRIEDMAETAISAVSAPGYALPESLLRAFERSASLAKAPW